MALPDLTASSERLFSKLETLLRGRPTKYIDDIQHMRELLTERRSKLPSGYMNQPRLLSAYTSFHFPLHLPEIAWILEQSFDPNKLSLPEVLIELGSGPGTASLGAALWMQWKKNHTPKEFAFFDQSKNALELAQELTQTTFPESKVFKVRGNLFDREDRRKLRSRADLLILSHVLNEIGNGPRYRETKLELLRKVVQDHMNLDKASTLIIIDPPLREPTMDIMWLRDEMNSEEHPFWSEQFEIVAPCPRGAKNCPMALAKLGWCYAQPPRTWARAAGLAPWDRDLEKAAKIELNHPGFSYLVIRKKDSPETHTTKHGYAVSDPFRVPSFVCKGTQIKRQGQVPHRGAYLRNGPEGTLGAGPREEGAPPRSNEAPTPKLNRLPPGPREGAPRGRSRAASKPKPPKKP